jgi:hypothetical protein
MFAQKTLFNKVLELPKTKAELDQVCCSSCFYAKDPECDCQCHGAFHGLGNLNKRDEFAHAMSKFQLPECRPLDRSEKIIDSLKNAKEANLQ